MDRGKFLIFIVNPSERPLHLSSCTLTIKTDRQMMGLDEEPS